MSLLFLFQDEKLDFFVMNLVWKDFCFGCLATYDHLEMVCCSCRYSTDYGMFRFCVADSEHDWREGSEQYEFIEKCLASVDRRKQPWLIFMAHRVLGYSSNSWYDSLVYFTGLISINHLN